MTDSPEFDAFDHERHMKRALELAREAMDRGDEPFGSVLVRDDEIVMVESNRIVTEDDLRRHPELHLAYRAVRTWNARKRARTVMYTSTAPCMMCCGGMRAAGLGRVVYSVSGADLAEFTGNAPVHSAAELLDGVTEVVGPVLPKEGRRIHEVFRR
jgi:tRNA(Arg) A34 adenosine deaminase TadA